MDLRLLDARQLESWRKRYREQLGYPVIPDFHEALCRLGRAYTIEEAGRVWGYAILSQEVFLPELAPVIPELFIEMTQARTAKQLLRAVFEKLAPKTVVGRTDDPLGFPLLLDLGMPNQVSSPLYILDAAPGWTEDPEWPIVASTLDDARRLLPLYSSVPAEDGGIPDEMSLLKSLAAWRHYRVLSGGEAAAVCYVAPQGQQYVSVTAIVSPDFRGRGLGRYLAAFAARRELAEGKVYVATMNPDNEAARRLVESLGARLAAYFVNFTPPAAGAAAFPG